MRSIIIPDTVATTPIPKNIKKHFKKIPQTPDSNQMFTVKLPRKKEINIHASFVNTNILPSNKYLGLPS